MKLCKTTVMVGLDQQEHYAIVAVGQPGWPIGLFGPTRGANAKHNKVEAGFFADAPAMMDMLEHLAKEFGDLDLSQPLSPGKLTMLDALAARASALVAKHRSCG